MKQALIVAVIIISIGICLLLNMSNITNDQVSYISIKQNTNEIKRLYFSDKEQLYIYFKVNDQNKVLSLEQFNKAYNTNIVLQKDYKQLTTLVNTLNDITNVFNIIYLDTNSIKVIEANCKNRKCILEGEISKAGQSIVCAPHKLVIKIMGETNIDA
ncbi:MAG: NusG domain II-containing protein [Mycoplasmatales bacterium]